MPLRLSPTAKSVLISVPVVVAVGAGSVFLTEGILTALSLNGKVDVGSVLPFVGIVLAFIAMISAYAEFRSKSLREKRIEQIEVKADKEPEKTRFAWDLAREKLEAYFDRNLSQVRMIFFVAVLVMIVGFGFILWGVSHGIANPESLKPSYLAALSGIITEFIGVTFMLIYRSTMAQANQFMEVLERINTVGMAVQILDAIPEQETALKNSTRAEIVSLLLSVNARSKSNPEKPEAKAPTTK
jgi:hypothetical protein